MDEDDDFDPERIIELPIDGTLDLHTFDPREVGELVPSWIDECQARGITELRIVHGKGKGALRRTVHALLARRSDVLAYGLAPPERGGWGATLVMLREGGGAGPK
ncbi:MAG: Smr/MutS family protein [Myxococcota bacterium]|nr:Smr/MutS family protein [Myxococcota bacterium]